MSVRYEVQIIRPQDGKAKRWSVYPDREHAEIEAAKLRAHKFFAVIRRVDDDPPDLPAAA